MIKKSILSLIVLGSLIGATGCSTEGLCSDDDLTRDCVAREFVSVAVEVMPDLEGDFFLEKVEGRVSNDPDCLKTVHKSVKCVKPLISICSVEACFDIFDLLCGLNSNLEACSK